MTSGPGASTATTRGATGRTARVAVLALAGLLLGTAASQTRDARVERRSDLVGVVRAEQARVAAASGRVEALQRQVDALADREAATVSGAAAARAAARALAAPAGLTEVTGAGVAVTLDDAKRRPGQPLPDGVTPDDLVVHQQDVQAVVNAFWTGGATAVQVMDQRLVSVGGLRCVGNTLVVQGRVYSPPFRLVAVGAPTRLVAALGADPAVGLYRDWARVVGLGFGVRTLDRVTVPAYQGPLPRILLAASARSAASESPAAEGGGG